MGNVVESAGGQADSERCHLLCDGVHQNPVQGGGFRAPTVETELQRRFDEVLDSPKEILCDKVQLHPEADLIRRKHVQRHKGRVAVGQAVDARFDTVGCNAVQHVDHLSPWVDVQELEVEVAGGRVGQEGGGAGVEVDKV